MKRKRILEVINATSPTNFVRLLMDFGFQRDVAEKSHSQTIRLFRGADEILLPSRADIRDYSRRILETLQIVRPKHLDIEDVVSMASLPVSDIYRHHFADDETRFGAFPLAEFPQAAEALFEMIRYTAAGIVSARKAYLRVPPDADAFARGCRVGQTDMQSYVIKIFCPISPAVERFVSTPEEPFGRMVVQACLENLQYLSEDESVIGDQAPPAALNKNVLSAVAKLRPMVFKPMAEASAWFNPWAAPVPEQFSGGAAIKISESTFNNASILARRFQPAEGNEVIISSGFIVDLHKDRPGRAQTLNHEVTMEVPDGSNWRNLRMSLLPSEYRRAVKWHDRNAKVRIEALVDKGRTWRVLEVRSMEALDSNQQELFGNSENPNE